MEPSGAVTVSTRSVPELIAPLGSRNDFTTVSTDVGAIAGPAFSGARTWSDEPVKSAWIELPSMVSASCTCSGWGVAAFPSR